MSKKRMALLLVIVMVLSVMAACAPANETTTTAGSQSTTATTKPAETTSATSGDVEIIWDSHNISWKLKTEPVTFDCYIDYDWYALDTWGVDDVSKEITKRTGVSLNVTKASDRNQLQVLLAADQLPEMVFTDNQVQRFFSPDFAYSFNELIEEYCPEFMNLIDPVEIINNTQPDGNFYTLRSHYNSKAAWEDPRNLPSPGNPGFYIREDIMVKLGNPPLESIEDLEAIYAMVKKDFPELIVYLPHPTWYSPFLEWFGLGTTKVLDSDGNLVHQVVTEQYKEWLMFMNRLQRNGYLNVEAYAYQPEQFFQIVRGSADIFSGSYNMGLADDTNKNYWHANGIDAKLVPVMKALTVNGENRFQPIDAGIGWSSLIISKNNKNPERAILYMEFLKSPEGDALTQWGIEGKHYTLSSEGLLVRPEGFADITIQEHGIGPWYFMASGLGEGVAVSSGKLTSPDYSSSVDLLQFRKPYFLRDPARAFTNPLPDSAEMAIESRMTDIIDQSRVAIIGAATEADALALYDQFQTDLKATGIDQLNQYYTTAYAAAKARYEGVDG